MVRKHDLPLFGVLSSLPLFWLATVYYPGGTAWHPDFVGYSWTENFISTLFQPEAINGAANSARIFALPAMLVFCVSIGATFWLVSRRCQSRALGKMIMIGGTGSMVYTFLALITPMHDLLVTIALVFFMVAVVSLLRMLYLLRKFGSVSAGLACLALLAASAVMYYGNVRFDLLPVFQKLVFVYGAAWLLSVHYGMARRPSNPAPLRDAV